MSAEPHRRNGRLSGRCLCGAVTVEVDGVHVAGVGACHCGICQRWSGGVYADFVAEADAVAVAGAVARHASSDFAERAFCPVCGSHLWFRRTGDPAAQYLLMPGLFPEASDFPLIAEIYVDRAPAYGTLRGDHPRQTRSEVEARNAHVEGD